MIQVAAAVGRSEIRCFLTTYNHLMDHLPHVCGKADKMTDCDANQYEMVNIRVNHEGTPVTFNLGLEPVAAPFLDNADVPEGRVLDEAEAGGFVCFNLFLGSLEKYGVTLICPEKNISLYETENFPGVGVGVAEQLRSTVFDGEPVYNGGGPKSVKGLMRDPARGYGDVTHITEHDPPHSGDLLKADACAAVAANYLILTVHKIIKEIYSHFSRSPQRCRGLCRLAAAWGVELQKSHYLFEVRFVASEALVLENFLEDLPVLVLYLQEEKARAAPEISRKIVAWLRVITGFKFVGMIVTQLDIDNVLSSFSVATQSDTLLVMDYLAHVAAEQVN